MRKKIRIFVVLIFFTAFGIAGAQEAPSIQGNFELGIGSIINFSVNPDPDIGDSKIDGGFFTYNSFYCGYFLIDGLSIGGNFMFRSNEIQYSTYASPTLTFIISPMVKFYIPVTSQFLINVTGIFTYSSTKVPLTGDDKITTTIMGGGAGAGLTYMFSDIFGIGFDLDYIKYADNKIEGITVVDSGDNTINSSLSFKVFL